MGDIEARWQDEEKRKGWYEKGISYWQSTVPTNDGVLGGYGRVHDSDVEDSLRFVRPFLPPSDDGGRPRKLRALDVGAGIGRVTGGLLLHICDTVDLLEGASKFVAQARLDLKWAGERVERYICEGMERFVPEPGRYDLVWIQWCIGSLTDEDFVTFFARLKQGVAPGGLVVLKDNILDPDATSQELDPTGKFLVDEDDCSVIRSRAHMLHLLTDKCGMEVLGTPHEANLDCDELFPVLCVALRFK